LSTPDFEAPPFLRRLQCEYQNVSDALNRSSEGADPRDGRSLFIRQLMALDQGRDRIAAQLQDIGTQAALMATHDCDQMTSLSAACLCRKILNLLNELKLGIG
jgi:hypothetical protein